MVKLLKKILTFPLIFALSFPTFSAVSVSDGSAFVSKSEYVSLMTNASSRVSSLENSIDKNIYEIVSSYLNKYGIWNGAKQTLLFTTVNCGTWMPSYIGNLSYYWANGRDLQQNLSGVSFNASSKENLGVLSGLNVSNKELANINKTGLAFINVEWITSLKNFKIYLTSKEYSYNFYINSTITFSGKTNNKSVSTSNNLNYTFAWGSYIYDHALYRDKYETLILFVSNGDTLLYSSNTDVNQFSIRFPTDCTIGWNINIKDITVY